VGLSNLANVEEWMQTCKLGLHVEGHECSHISKRPTVPVFSKAKIFFIEFHSSCVRMMLGFVARSGELHSQFARNLRVMACGVGRRLFG